MKSFPARNIQIWIMLLAIVSATIGPAATMLVVIMLNRIAYPSDPYAIYTNVNVTMVLTFPTS
jgi:hypothetical protein